MRDVVIVGAGAAGLAAAQRLGESGIDATIVEARDRVGGRIWTLHRPTLKVPVELGAEFTHGDAAEIDAIALTGGLRTIDIAGRRWQARSGRLSVMDDFWERLDRVMRRLKKTPARRDRSFADAIAAIKSGSPRDRQLARQFVEGFHAADLNCISESALAEGGSPRGDIRERRIGRVLEGYDAVLNELAPRIDNVRFSMVVTAVRWRDSDVELEVREPSGELLPPIQARRVVVTVPVGALRDVAFDPPIESVHKAVADIAMGSVCKVTLEMDRPFWTTRQFGRRIGDERLDTLSFLHAGSDTAFPVWWTHYPVRAPVMTGWRGGPGAAELSRLPQEQIKTEAMRSLAELLGMSRAALGRHVVATYMHDWVGDPYARGAYSYLVVGGAAAPRRLAVPVRDTVFFAGEHTDSDGRSGTVHGAIASGWRAADQVVRAISGRA